MKRLLPIFLWIFFIALSISNGFTEVRGLYWLGSNQVTYLGSTSMVIMFNQQPYGEIWVKIFYYRDDGYQSSNSKILFAIAHVVIVPGSTLYQNNYKSDWMDIDIYIDTPYRSPYRQVVLDRGPGDGWPIFYCERLGLRDDRAYVDLDVGSTYITYCYYAPAGVNIEDRTYSTTYIRYYHELDEGGTVGSQTYPADPGYVVQTYNHINGKWWVYVNVHVNARFVEQIWWWFQNPYTTGWLTAYVDYHYP